MTILLVASGGAVGAAVRYLAGRYVHSYGSFPLPTFGVNVVGCFLLGALAGASVSPQVFALMGTGFCGGLTTYSTFAVEADGLARVHRPFTSLAYVAASVMGGLGAAWIGFHLTA